MTRTHGIVSPMLDSGQLASEADRLAAAADSLAEELVPLLASDSPAPPDRVRLAALETVGTFVRSTIPEMVAVGRHLTGRH